MEKKGPNLKHWYPFYYLYIYILFGYLFIIYSIFIYSKLHTCMWGSGIQPSRESHVAMLSYTYGDLAKWALSLDLNSFWIPIKTTLEVSLFRQIDILLKITSIFILSILLDNRKLENTCSDLPVLSSYWLHYGGHKWRP